MHVIRGSSLRVSVSGGGGRDWTGLIGETKRARQLILSARLLLISSPLLVSGAPKQKAKLAKVLRARSERLERAIIAG